jgi:hypothetical protein
MTKFLCLILSWRGICADVSEHSGWTWNTNLRFRRQPQPPGDERLPNRIVGACIARPWPS